MVPVWPHAWHAPEHLLQEQEGARPQAQTDAIREVSLPKPNPNAPVAELNPRVAPAARLRREGWGRDGDGGGGGDVWGRREGVRREGVMSEVV